MMRRLFAFALLAAAAQAHAEGGIFVGSTPCGPAVKQFLGLPADRCDVVRWNLSLALDAKSAEPGPAAVNVEFGVDGKRLRKLHRDLAWEISVGTREHKDAKVIELERGKSRLFLWKVTDETLYLLDARRHMLVGNAAFSYALSFAVVDKLQPAGSGPQPAYKPRPLSAGPTVYGVFEGRTPCDVAAMIDAPLPGGCHRLDWRLTLFQDAKTRGLTTYRLEGSLFGSGPREGDVSPLDGTPFDPTARVLKLELPAAARSEDGAAQGPGPVYLMRGDDDVLFILDRAGKLGLGDRESNYVLSRRAT